MLNRRNFLSASSAVAVATLLPNQRVATAQTVESESAAQVVDPMSVVDPEFRQPLQAMEKTVGGMFDKVDDTTLIKISRERDEGPQHLAASPIVTEHLISRSPNNPPVKVFVTGDTAGASRPAILHIHGGGYIAGTAASSRAQIQDLARTLDCVAVTVDYRLAPETHFPGSLEDNYAALRWMNTNAKDLGIDVTRVAVKGESAGGGHAAALAIAARDRKEFSICLQVLCYPMLDDRTGSSRMPEPAFGHFIWTSRENRLGWTSLLGVPAGSAQVPANSVPARIQNFAGLPPAFIGVGGIDLFAPEDIDYAGRLLRAGVPTELSVVPGGYHGFDLFAPNASLSRQFTQAWNEAIRRAFQES
jgi:acetyl esterase/lipase